MHNDFQHKEATQMTPTKIRLEITKTHIQLRVFAPQTVKGSTVIESTPFANGVGPKEQTVASMRKHGAKYAKRFAIPFEDQTISACAPDQIKSQVYGRPQ